MLKGSLCVHYHRDPERRTRYLAEVGKSMPAGYGADDQTGLLFTDGELTEAFTAREGAGVWKVTPSAQGGVEEPVEAVAIRPKPKPDAPGDPVQDFRNLSKWRRSGALL